MTERRQAWLVFFFGLLVALSCHFGRELVDFEIRFALFAKDMLAHGFSLFPQINQVPYPDYPVTQTVLIALTSFVLGQVNLLSAILPNALASAMTLTLTYKIGASINQRLGLYAVLLLLLCNAFFSQMRTVSIDQFVVLVTTACFYHAYRAKTHLQAPNCWLLGGLLFFGFACRGPIGLVMPAGVLTAFYALSKDFKAILKVGIISIIAVMAGLLLLLGGAYKIGGLAFTHKVFAMEFTDRLHKISSKPWYFYWKSLLYEFLIPAPFALLALIAALKDKTIPPKVRQLIFALAAWVGIIILGMSIPSAKKIRYILPIAPAIALLGASVLAMDSTSRLLLAGKRGLIGLITSLPFLGLVLLATAQFHPKYQNHLAHGHPLIAGACLGSLAFALLYKNRLKEATLYCLLIGFVSFFIINSLLVEAINANEKQTKPFIEAIRKQSTDNDTVIFYKMPPGGNDENLLLKWPGYLQPKYSNTLLATPKTIYLLTEKSYRTLSAGKSASFKVIARGSIGRDAALALRAR